MSHPAPHQITPSSAPKGVTPRAIGRVNWLGLWTLYQKEVRRFLKVFVQTVAAPMVTSLLFLLVFTLALGRGDMVIGGVPYSEFLAPGLIMMAIAQNAFANTSSSLVVAKVQGNIVDTLMPPLGPAELTAGYALGGVTRGLAVGCSTLLAMWLFVPVSIAHPAYVLFHALSAALLLSLLGIIGGIWADKFDHIAAVTNFVIVPLTFLSGTFYSTERLPGIWYELAHVNPFFFMIDGFRYGFIDHADAPPLVGIAVMTGCNLVLLAISYAMLKSGYKLKA
ncbi:ABC transporter permease [Oceanibaculum sp.]|uniref:ABC transporter permease n=1 Tax=Oceanibaculum sp. TaxID=1903597 RepID=UPI00258748C4|nr:ABC transporter permease [Oceanibaculum sp.]MCH2394725.1 ABC transporter permease [Oceanibaculum sp.]